MDVPGNLGSSRRIEDDEAGKEGDRECVEEEGSKDEEGEWDLYASGSPGTGGTSES